MFLFRFGFEWVLLCDKVVWRLQDPSNVYSYFTAGTQCRNHFFKLAHAEMLYGCLRESGTRFVHRFLMLTSHREPISVIYIAAKKKKQGSMNRYNWSVDPKVFCTRRTQCMRFYGAGEGIQSVDQCSPTKRSTSTPQGSDSSHPANSFHQRTYIDRDLGVRFFAGRCDRRQCIDAMLSMD